MKAHAPATEAHSPSRQDPGIFMCRCIGVPAPIRVALIPRSSLVASSMRIHRLQGDRGASLGFVIFDSRFMSAVMVDNWPMVSRRKKIDFFDNKAERLFIAGAWFLNVLRLWDLFLHYHRLGGLLLLLLLSSLGLRLHVAAHQGLLYACSSCTSERKFHLGDARKLRESESIERRIEQILRWRQRCDRLPNGCGCIRLRVLG